MAIRTEGTAPADFVSHVRAQAAHHARTRSYTYLRGVGRELVEEVVTYEDLDRGARAIAAWLATRPERDRPVLLLHADAIDFLPAFLGCLYAGVVAVPAPLPHDARSMQRTVGMFEDADIGLVLTTQASLGPLTTWAADSGLAERVTFVATDAGPLGDPADWQMPELTGETIAFLQYTSGSTSEPKGVMVTHANLLHNCTVIAAALELDDTTIGAGWLPHFHDMGLVGQLLTALHVGADLVFMSPISFLRRPIRWLQAIDRYGATVTVAPNFSYELLARRVSDEDLAGLDLSTLRVALNGAEPVRPHVLDAVITRLGAAGFRPDAFVASYGMAEVTLLASASRVARPPRYLDVDPDALERHEVVACDADRAARLVSNGPPRGVDLRIVDPETRRVLPAAQVGEIWLRGPSVAVGYLHRQEENAEKFDARTADGDGPFLRTGDLGALHDGELYVTGRLKDLLIVNGRNLYPQDIEEAVSRIHPALATAPGVVLNVDAGREHIVVIHGVDAGALDGMTPEALTAQIRGTVARAFDVPAPSVVLVKRSAVHRTTSGKVQRRSMLAAFMANGVEGLVCEAIDPAVQRVRASAGA
ncbi:MAG: fatty acyl-AMP ligase [Solirubrobacteraceae bacterium]|nr:fatty acyl-AMP ligase [Solirubrobacteraceae bacterium]